MQGKLDVLFVGNGLPRAEMAALMPDTIAYGMQDSLLSTAYLMADEVIVVTDSQQYADLWASYYPQAFVIWAATTAQSATQAAKWADGKSRGWINLLAMAVNLNDDLRVASALSVRYVLRQNAVDHAAAKQPADGGPPIDPWSDLIALSSGRNEASVTVPGQPWGEGAWSLMGGCLRYGHAPTDPDSRPLPEWVEAASGNYATAIRPVIALAMPDGSSEPGAAMIDSVRVWVVRRGSNTTERLQDGVPSWAARYTPDLSKAAGDVGIQHPSGPNSAAAVVSPAGTVCVYMAHISINNPDEVEGLIVKARVAPGANQTIMARVFIEAGSPSAGSAIQNPIPIGSSAFARIDRQRDIGYATIPNYRTDVYNPTWRLMSNNRLRSLNLQ